MVLWWLNEIDLKILCMNDLNTTVELLPDRIKVLINAALLKGGDGVWHTEADRPKLSPLSRFDLQSLLQVTGSAKYSIVGIDEGDLEYIATGLPGFVTTESGELSIIDVHKVAQNSREMLVSLEKVEAYVDSIAVSMQDLDAKIDTDAKVTAFELDRLEKAIESVIDGEPVTTERRSLN